MANKQVILYKSGRSYLAFPPFLADKGGNKIDFFNITGDRLYVALPDKAGSKACEEIPAGEKIAVVTKGQEHPINVYQYAIGEAPCPKKPFKKKKKNKKRLDGSDPILILEN
ncbi:MAG TPA: hypothetical protein VFP85_16705 [Vicinamibacterales bacterium]|nr:hypothetical protein [Vicinamibacterales bacterium]